MKIYSKKACLVVINHVAIKPAESDISKDEYDAIKDHKDFRMLVANGDIEIDEPNDEVEDASKSIDKMNKAELKAYALELGIDLEEGLGVKDIRDIIETATAE